MNTVIQASVSERRSALALLLGPWPDPIRAQKLDRLTQLLSTGELDPTGLLVCRSGSAITGALLLQRGNGRTATIGLPHVHPRDAQVEWALARAAWELLPNWNVDYAQIDLAPAEFDYGPIFQKAGFAYLTQLEFYRKDLTSVPEPILPEGLNIDPVLPDQHGEFIRVLFETYHETLDSPELNGTRSEADVLADYQCQSYFPPKWWLIRKGGLPIGVLVLSPSLPGPGCELSYLGLIPSARGQQLGTLLLAYALGQARQLAQQVVLSLDERNHPARQLYLRAGFQLYQLRRIYWWRPASLS